MDRRIRTPLFMASRSRERPDNLLSDQEAVSQRPLPNERQKWSSLLKFHQASDSVTLISACILAICSGIAEPVLSIFFARFFDAFSQLGSSAIDTEEFTHRAKVAILTLLGISGVMLLLKSGYLCLWVIYGESQAKTAREWLFQNLLQLETTYHDSSSSGISAELTKLQIYIREFQLAVSQPLGFVFSHTVQCFTSLAVALYYNWKLALIISVGIGIATLCLSVISVGLARAVECQHVEMSMASNIVGNMVKNIVTVKCCNAQKQEHLSYCASVKRAATFYIKQARISAIRIGFIGCAITLILMGALYYATVLIHQGSTTPTAAMTTFFCCLMAAQGFQTILPNLIVLEKGKNAASSLCSILGENRSAHRRRRNGHAPMSLLGDIVFTNVSFSYPNRPEYPVLRHSNLRFEAGKLTFLIGPSGSGKTTLINLIQNKFDADDGQVTIDGIDVKQLDTDWLRNNITIMQQDSNVFNETVFRNIAFGRSSHLSISTQEVQRSLSFAEVVDLVKLLPHGLETVVGIDGVSLSGGQRQRLILARTYLRDVPILILDEPIASLDPKLRTSIMRKIRTWRRGKTTIMITHDLSHIGEDDPVYSLQNDGSIIEIASFEHESLTSPRTASMANQLVYALEKVRSSVQSSDVDNTKLTSTGRRATPRNVDVQSSTWMMEPAHRRLSRALIFHTGPATSWYRSSTLRPSRNSSLVPQESVTEMSTIVSSKMLKLDNNDRRFSTYTAQKRTQTQYSDTSSASAPLTRGLKPILRTVWPSLNLRYRCFLLCGCLCITTYAACPAIFSYLVVQNFENWTASDGWQARARYHVVAGVGLAFVDGGSAFLMHYILEHTGQKWVDALRTRAFAHVLEQPKSWFDTGQITASEISLTLTRNAEEVRNIIGRFCALILVAVIMMSVAIIWSFIVCWKITIVTLASIPLLYGITQGFQFASTYWEGRTNVLGNKVGAIFSEVFGNITTVRSLTLESFFHRKCLTATNKAYRIGIKRGFATGLCFGISESAIYFVTTAIFAYGVELAKSQQYSIPSLLQALALLLFSTSNASSIIAYIPQISNSVDTGLQLLELTQLPMNSHEKDGYIMINVDQSATTRIKSIVFNNTTFRYPTRPERMVLCALNVCFEPGQWTAIVGTSGSGKSTIASLLLKLYQVSATLVNSEGVNSAYQLTLFGSDISQVETNALRDLCSFVPQEPVIVSGTVRENILYGDLRPDIKNDNNMEDAARASDIHDFIAALPHGYDTILGPGGFGLSGGQAQRIVIARAIARRPKVLILDEATRSLDSKSAERIRNSLVHWIQSTRSNRTRGNNFAVPLTIISITHDIEMMACADHVVVIQDGSVGEEGNFTELLNKHGLLWELLNRSSQYETRP